MYRKLGLCPQKSIDSDNHKHNKFAEKQIRALRPSID